MNLYQMLAPKVGEYSRDSFSGRPNHLSNFLMCKGQSNAGGLPALAGFAAFRGEIEQETRQFLSAEPESPRYRTSRYVA